MTRIDRASCVVTGGSSGIGHAVARSLAARGARLTLVGRDAEALASAAERLGCDSIAADLSSADETERVARAMHRLQPDILVNAAGIGLSGALASAGARDIDRVLAVNLRAPIMLARAVVPGMTGRRSGHIVNIASIVGHTGHRDEAVYAATKGGLIAFGESVRYELEPLGVGVSLVTPGVVATPFFDRRGVPYDRRRPRPVSAERVAAAVIRAIETGKAEIVVPPWLAIAPRVRGVAPALFRRLTARLG